MWSSSSEDQQQHHKCLNKNLTAKSSSKSSSTTSSSFSLSNNHHPQNFRLHKTMEEVWKDIHLSSLNDKTSSSRDIDPQNTTSSATNNFGGTIVQDFLARPFSNDPPIALGHDSPAPPPPPPPHVSMLTLNSGLKFNFFNSLRQNTHSNQKTISQVGSFNRSFEAYANGRKRNNESNNNSSDQKNKRMIKNRESAARSRARKQAYTSELEREIAHLMKENASLKNQQQQQLSLAAAAQLPKKNSLYRTSTAPF